MDDHITPDGKYDVHRDQSEIGLQALDFGGLWRSNQRSEWFPEFFLGKID